jgi:hypothetical protein
MAAALDPLTPAVRIAPSGSASTAAGERPSANSFKNLPWIVDAAAPASCWYMIDRTNAAKPSGSGSRSSSGPADLMRRAIAGSRRATSLLPLASSCCVEGGSVLALIRRIRT